MRARAKATRRTERPTQRRMLLQTGLTAREVQEAVEERISKGIYALGERLPPVRSIATEFGTSPSTVSRAVQEMIRSGWLEVQGRQFVRVRNQVQHKAVGHAEIQRSIKSVAHKWKLWGGSQEQLLNSIKDIVREVFEAEGQFVFTECNLADLNFMGKQLASELPNLSIARSLIDDLDAEKLRENKSIVLVPYYHFAEVKERVGKDIAIVPVHYSPSAETLDELLTIPQGANVLVVGHNKRSVARLSGMVRGYVEAKITSVNETESGKIAKLAQAADVVVAVWSAADALIGLPGVKHVIVVRFVLDASVNNRLKLGD